MNSTGFSDRKERVVRAFLSRQFSPRDIFLIAFGSVSAAFVVRLALFIPLDDKATFVFFVPAILVVAVIAGFRGAVFTCALSVFAIYLLKEWTTIRGAVPMEMLVVSALSVTTALVGDILHVARKAIARAQTALDAREALLSSMLDTVLDAAIVSKQDGTILSFNSAAVRLFGYKEDEAIGMNLSMLMPETCRTLKNGLIDDYVNPDEEGLIRLDQVVTGLRKDGSTFPLKLSIGQTRSGNETVITGFVRDLTEQEETAARLQQIQSELARLARLTEMGEMASSLAHELNQPLSAIANYVHGCTRLLRGIDGDVAAKMRDALQETADQSLRAGQIIKHLREFVSKGETEKAPHNIRRLMEEAAALALVGAREKGVRTIFELNAGPEMIMADRIQIQQVLINLMRNAIEAMGDSQTRELAIRARIEAGDELAVLIEDTGPGISKEIAAQLFKPFVTTKAEGMGMGLSISKRIVEAHGGGLTVTGNRSGGASFRVTLPVYKEEELANALV